MFHICITETLETVIDVSEKEAATEEEARQLVKRKYDVGGIVLGAENLTDCTIEPLK